MRVRLPAASLTFALWAGARPLDAQVTFRSTGREFADAVSDIVYTTTGPFHTGARDLLAGFVITGGFAALLPVDDDIDRWIVEHPNAALLDVARPFRSSNTQLARLPTDARLLPISGTLLLTGMVTGARGLREAGYGCASAWLVSNTVRAGAYAAVSRARPRVPNSNQWWIAIPGNDWNFHSFFSGHTMNAFACVTYANTRFHLGLAEPLLYGLASSISLARMDDRLHWASDSYLGMVAGIAVGRTLALRAKRRDERRETLARQSSWFDGVRVLSLTDGVALSWRRNF